jgi:hypothetical protein
LFSPLIKLTAWHLASGVIQQQYFYMFFNNAQGAKVNAAFPDVALPFSKDNSVISANVDAS